MDVIMPQLGETVAEGTVAAWRKQVGDKVEVDDILLEIETDKVATEVPAVVAGVVAQILVAEGEVVKVGTKLAVIETADGAAPKAAATSASAEAPKAVAAPQAAMAAAPNRLPRTGPNGLPLSPAVRKLIAEHALDPARIKGTGKGGRIQRADVLGFLGRAPKVATPPAATAAAPVSGGVREIPFTTLRKRIAEHMVRSKATSAHVLQAIEADFSAVDRVRTFFKASWKAREGTSLTYLPFIARAVCMALKEFPNFNAHVKGEALAVYDRINLGFAIDLDFTGLVAPVLKGAGDMRVADLARGINALAKKARANKLAPDDMTEATFSITNNGTYGTLITAPIINQPQVAILSTDGVTRRPWVVNGPDGEAIEIRPVGVLAQSFDHRAIDGAYSGAFLKRVKEIIETYDWAQEFL